MPQATFATKSEAYAAGYTDAKRGVHKDVSGPNSFGYDFEDVNGMRTINIYFTHEKNSLGGLGCVVPMFPPKK